MSAYKYSDLVKLGTQYARRMNYLSNRIFGEVARTTNEKSMKVLIMQLPNTSKGVYPSY